MTDRTKTLEQEADYLTDNEIENEALRNCDNASLLRVSDFEMGARLAREHYEPPFRSALAAATARDKEIEELRAELNDWRETARKAADESCSDEAHCTCVGALRKLVADLSGLVRYVTFHHGYYSYQSQKTRDESYYFTPAGVGGGGVEIRLPDEFQEAARIAHGVPPIPLPENTNNKEHND